MLKEYVRPDDGALMREVAPHEYVAVSKPRKPPKIHPDAVTVYSKPKNILAFRYGPPEGCAGPDDDHDVVVRWDIGPKKPKPFGYTKGKSRLTFDQRQSASPQWWRVEEYVRACKIARLRDAVLNELGEVTYPAPLTYAELWSDGFCIRTVVKDDEGNPVKATDADRSVAAAVEGVPAGDSVDDEPAGDATDEDGTNEPAKVERPWHRWCMLKSTGTPEERGRRLVAIARYQNMKAGAGADLLLGRDVDLMNIGAAWQRPNESVDAEPMVEPELFLDIRRTLDESTGELGDKGVRIARGKQPEPTGVFYSPEDILDARTELPRVEKKLGKRHVKVLDLILQGATFEAVGEALFRGAKEKTAQRKGVAAFRAAVDALADALKIELKIKYVVETQQEIPISPAETCPLVEMPGLLVGGESSTPPFSQTFQPPVPASDGVSAGGFFTRP